VSSGFTARLRSVLGTPSVPPPAAPSPPSVADAAADVLDGDWRDVNGQRFLVVDRSYSPGYRHGRVAIADAMPPSDGVWPSLGLLAGGDVRLTGTRLLFVDLETTGLAGGAGTYAFLVGCAWFDGGTFRVRQFFLSSFSAERALLEAVAEMAAGIDAVVTYNGKTFDLPLIDTRFLMHRSTTPFAGTPHIDMLHPARRLWRAAGDDGIDGDRSVQPGCRLSVLEQSICGHTREGDVPGFEIPGRYFHFVRSGDPRGLCAVLEHNRLDLLSLALLTSRAAQLLDDGADAAQTAREALGLGRLLERGGRMAEARRCFARADQLPGDSATRAEALRALAVACRRDRCHEDAAAAWRRLLQLPRCPRPILREATEALAVHHEHRLRDPGAARTFAVQGLQCQPTPARRQALAHRLARLERKLGEARDLSAPLF
jgi:uncharacterized protein YprB with RNaseH-like and TPR domain